ncbi:iron dependent repressor, metal binding and dimerization domain protein [Clostridium cochlearium]|uniref:Manganese transport regulator n=1 Tax=Clostridium cochlearium TaxID=1494 RepID=A0A239Z8F0_CLOCO|nr:iron dependent repressor, metal binding and dimerization domain protein [Clostridium cochlearium]NSJ91773.1 DtxR family transcriptional regulator [Coprococcus sp. MSK.21.13]MBU5270319.1 DtxR family transcriptional regulator [Clostridium cochlearium]MCR1972285.1 DtxR family transcriptional regulator [Clostridium cochlearium]MDU1442520.1 iron dependent repressor, metal binding and dimerization domain protein [Clostridium cochlearium]NMA58151.1 DtxR family transcriptional regulator [Clostridiu
MNSNKKFHTVRGYEILKKHKNLLTNSMEDYLEMIYRNSLECGYTRINEISKSLNIRPSSATKMVQKLSEIGFVNYEKYGIIKLTKKGEDMGSFLLKRHSIIENFLKNIGVKKDILVNIELIEHSVTKEALEKIDLLNRFLKENDDIKEKLQNFTK